MVRMNVAGLTIDQKTKTPIVILREVDGSAILPIWVGAMEAMTISLELGKEQLPHPLTHDLLLLCLGALDATLRHAEISSVKDGIYYAALTLRHRRKDLHVDCRPSDAIALALRAGAPILVKRELLSATRENDAENRRTDAASDMLRRAGARREMDILNGILGQRGSLPDEDAPDTERRLLDLLRIVDPAIRQKM